MEPESALKDYFCNLPKNRPDSLLGAAPKFAFG
jgi:hypothetical protein